MTGQHMIFPAANENFSSADQAVEFFNKRVSEISQGRLALVKYHGNQCPPCRNYEPVLKGVLDAQTGKGREIPLMIVSIDALIEKLPDLEERREFLRRLKGSTNFPDLQAYRNGRLTGGIRLYEEVYNLAIGENPALEKEETYADENFPAAGMKAITIRFLEAQMRPVQQTPQPNPFIS